MGGKGRGGSPRGNPSRDLGVRPPGFPAGGASLAGAENSIGSRDVSPPELRVSTAALLPLHCLWEEPEEKRGVGQDLLPRSEYNSSQSRQRALASPSLERGLCSRENV